MKQFGVFVIFLFQMVSSFSMETMEQPESQQGVQVSKTQKRIDSYVDATKEMTISDERSLLEYRHPFFTKCAWELIDEPHGQKLGDEGVSFLKTQILGLSKTAEISFHNLYILCVFTALLLSNERQYQGVDVVLDNTRQFLRGKEICKKLCKSSQEYYEQFYATIVLEFAKEKDNNHTMFIISGTLNKFFPFFLINNLFFKMDDYFYGLSKRVHILSLPYQSSCVVHGGYYEEPMEVFGHDIAHLSQFESVRAGFCPMTFTESLGANIIARKNNMLEKVGQYFFDLLQGQGADKTTKAKLKEIGFNLTHENWSRKEIPFPTDSTLKNNLRYLIDCLKINLEKEFLPNSLKTFETFKSSLKESYVFFLKLKYPTDFLNRINRGLISVTVGDDPYMLTVSYKGAYSQTVSYTVIKRTRVDLLKSAVRAGYKLQIPKDNITYNPTEVRKPHLEMLTWFERNYFPT